MKATEMNEKVTEALENRTMTAEEIAQEMGADDHRALRFLNQHLNWMEQNGLVETSYELGERVYTLK